VQLQLLLLTTPKARRAPNPDVVHLQRIRKIVAGPAFGIENVCLRPDSIVQEALAKNA
jgi:hypothetical protein